MGRWTLFDRVGVGVGGLGWAFSDGVGVGVGVGGWSLSDEGGCPSVEPPPVEEANVHYYVNPSSRCPLLHCMQVWCKGECFMHSS